MFGNSVTDSHHIIFRTRSHTDTDGPFAIHTHQVGRRVHIASFDGCDITQAYFAPTLCHDQLVAYILYTFISTFGTYTKLVGPGHDLTRIDQQVLGLQDLLNRIRIDPQIRQLGNRDTHIHDLRLFRKQIDLLHTLNRSQLGLDLLRPIAHIVVSKTFVGCQSVIDTEHVPEIITHIDGRGATRKARLYISHLTTQFVPLDRHIIRGQSRLQLDRDLRHAEIRFRLDLKNIRHGLNFPLDRFRYQFFYLLRSSTRILRNQNSLLDYERRVLLLRQFKERIYTSYQHDSQKEIYNLLIL